MEYSIECPHCRYKHENWSDYIENGDMDGEFNMNCEECDKEFIVKFETTIKFESSIKKAEK